MRKPLWIFTFVRMRIQKPVVYKKIFIFIAYLIAALLAYFPILDNNYFSDDFDTIQRLTVQKQFWSPGFFRPLSDAGIVFVHKLAGQDAGAQYATAILMLAGGAFLFYCFSKSIFSKDEIPEWIHQVGGILFLLYPFHFESMAWCVGRGSMQAALLALWSIFFALNNHTNYKKILLSQILYFLALATYETVFVVPALVFFLVYIKTNASRNAFLISACYASTLFVHFALRIFTTGSIFGSYQKDGFAQQSIDYFSNYAKAISRTVVLPLLNTDHFALATACFFLLIIFLLYKILKQSTRYQKLIVICLTICLLITLIVAAIFSISVKTSEGDRLLFLPSIFVILLLIFFISHLKRYQLLQKGVIAIVAVYFCYNLYVQHTRWNEASEIIDETMAACKKMIHGTTKNVAILNLPDTYLGAYVYRHGFKSCLQQHGVDSSRINALSYFMEWDYRDTEMPFSYQKINDSVLFNNYATLTLGQQKTEIIIKDTSIFRLNLTQFDIWFWNKTNYQKIVIDKK